MPPRKPAKPANLWKHGDRWWTRVYAPDCAPARRSTGTDDLAQATRVLGMLDVLRRQDHVDLLQRANRGEVPLPTLYYAFLSDTLPQLRARLADVDVEPFVGRWLDELAAGREVSPKTLADYTRQVRSLVPAGQPFPRSRFTEAAVRQWLGALPAAFSTSTRRRYFDGVRAFVGWAMRHVPLAGDPTAHVPPPKNAAPRSTYHEFAQVTRVLAAVTDPEVRAFLALLYGSGMELGAALAARGLDVHAGHRTVYAHGTKTGYRSRPCFVDRWAWDGFVWPHVRRALPTAPLFTLSGDRARDLFYQAQVAVGLAERPAAGERWRVHTLHDCRHSFCVIRTLGQDGEPQRDLQYLADQLGHADTVMVSRIYAKFRLRERLLAQADHDAAQAAHAAEGAPALTLRRSGANA